MRFYLTLAGLLLVIVAAGFWFKLNVDHVRDNIWLARAERSGPAQLFAWTYDLTPEEIHSALEYFPNLGAVLYSSNYGAARHPGSWIAYVRGEDDARLALATADSWQAFIVADELNIHGVSPEDYQVSFAGVYRILEGHAPVATQGLAAQGSWWRELFWTKRFDDAYHRGLPDAQLRSFNPNKVSLRELRRVLRNYRTHDWILSPAPFNDPLNRFRQPVDATQWLAVAERSDVFGVAFWSLVQATGPDGETYQTHGLLDRFGRLTATGTVVQRYLVTPSPRYGRVRPRPTSSGSGQ